MPVLSVAWTYEDFSEYYIFVFLSVCLSVEMVPISSLEMARLTIEKITTLCSIKHLFWQHCWLLFSLFNVKKSMLIERTRPLSLMIINPYPSKLLQIKFKVIPKPQARNVNSPSEK